MDGLTLIIEKASLKKRNNRMREEERERERKKGRERERERKKKRDGFITEVKVMKIHNGKFGFIFGGFREK